MGEPAAATTHNEPHLKRVLGLRALVLTGIIFIQPTAPMPLFGVVSQEARGHVVTTVLVALVAMLFTAVSYGRMARVYPAAGSAYTYVGRELHPALGYMTGWSLLADYVLNPLICTIWSAKAAMNFLPEVPYAFWIVFFAALFTLLNLRGIRASARTNEWVAAALGLVIVAFLVAAIRYVFALPHPPGFWTRPFYDPATFSLASVSTGTSVAVLTYIGFDGLSTLAEEVKDPRRTLMRGIVLTCLITGILATIQVYFGQLVWPDFATYPDVDTAFVHIAGRAGGPVLFSVVNLALLIATIGSGMGAHLAAARLLYGMGRDNAIPRSFFGYLSPGTAIPRNNVLLVGAVVLAGAFVLNYQLGAELLNFGAFVAFMGVNASSFVHYYVRGGRRLADALIPAAGFLICFYIWLNLRTPAKIAGACWLLFGVLYGAWKTRGFKRDLIGSSDPFGE